MKRTKIHSKRNSDSKKKQHLKKEAKKIWGISSTTNIGNFFISCRKGLLLSKIVK